MMLLYKLCYDAFFWLKRRKRSKKIVFLKKVFTYISDSFSYYFWVLLNRKYPAYFEKHPVKNGLNTKKRDERYIVSLTSFPARINHVHLSIETLMRQSFKADEIVLWLAKEQFSNAVLPKRLEELKDKGLTIRFCDDLRSHKKYYYTFREYPNDNIIIVDDDLFYPTDLLKKLVRLHKKHPKDIACESAQIIYPNLSAMPTEWIVAENYADYSSSLYVQSFQGCGVLYPPRWYSDELFNLENIRGLAFTADDLWLKAMSIISGVRTTKENKFRAFYVEIDIPNNETLFSVNKSEGENLNNIVWKALIEAYELEKYEN